MSSRGRNVFALALLSAGVGSLLVAQEGSSAPARLGRDVLREMIEVNTTDAHGSTTVLANKLAARFTAAGFPATDVQVVGPADSTRHHSLVVRWRGTGTGTGTGTARPFLLLAHLDVVEARREDWSFDPFTLVERDVSSTAAARRT